MSASLLLLLLCSWHCMLRQSSGIFVTLLQSVVSSQANPLLVNGLERLGVYEKPNIGRAVGSA